MILKDTNIGRLILEHLQTEKTASKKTDKSVCVEDAKKISEGLSKVASLPYKKEAFNSLQELMKIASEYLGNFAETFKSVQSRNSELEKAAEVRVIMDDMVRIGQVDQYTVEEKIAELMNKSVNELEIVKEAMKMIENGKNGNMFFELEKDATASEGKRGMFDSVLQS